MGFEPGLVALSGVASQRFDQFGQRVRPVSESLAGRLGRHSYIQKAFVTDISLQFMESWRPLPRPSIACHCLVEQCRKPQQTYLLHSTRWGRVSSPLSNDCMASTATTNFNRWLHILQYGGDRRYRGTGTGTGGPVFGLHIMTDCKSIPDELIKCVNTHPCRGLGRADCVVEEVI